MTYTHTNRYVLVTLALAACTSEPMPQDGTPGTSRIEGRAENASTVSAYTVTSSGDTQLLQEVAVAADGSYALEVDAEQLHILLDGHTEQDAHAGSTVVISSDIEGDVVYATPITDETTLEANVWLEATAQSDLDIDLVAIRTRIEDDLDAFAEDETAIATLALALEAAQRAEYTVFADTGSSITADLLAELDGDLGAELDDDAELDDEWLLDARMEAWTSLGVSTSSYAFAQAQAGAAIRAVLEAQASEEAWFDAAWVSTAHGELHAAAMATVDILTEADADSDAVDAAGEASVTLREELDVATTHEAVVDAYATFTTTLVGDEDVEGSILDIVADAQGEAEASAEALIDAAVSASTSFEAAVQLAVEGSAALDMAEIAATAVTQAWIQYEASVESASQETTGDLSASTNLATDISLVATGFLLCSDDQ